MPKLSHKPAFLTDAGKLNAEEETDDEEVPFISLGEMLEDLHIVEDATGGEGDPMME